MLNTTTMFNASGSGSTSQRNKRSRNRNPGRGSSTDYGSTKSASKNISLRKNLQNQSGGPQAFSGATKSDLKLHLSKASKQPGDHGGASRNSKLSTANPTSVEGISTMMSQDKDEKQANDRYNPVGEHQSSTVKEELKKKRRATEVSTGKPAQFKKSIERMIRQVDANASTQKNMDADTRKQITMNTEDQLYKFKRKIYAGDHLNVEGYS